MKKKNKIESSVAFIAFVPHHIHKECARVIRSIKYNYTLNIIIEGKNINLLGRSYILNQLVSFIKCFFIPNHSIFLCEGIATLLPVLIKKIFNPQIKCIVINSDNFFYSLSTDKKRKNIFIDMYLRTIDGMISTSEYMKKQAEKFIKVPHEVVYPWVDYNKFSGITPNLKSKKVGFFTALRKNKGADIAINAIRNIRKKDKSYSLNLVGRKEENIKTEFEGITYLGFISPASIPAEFSSIGTYINPARHEPFGVSILESMSCGIPPIVSNHCGAAEIIKKIEPKLVINSDENALTGAIEWINKDINRKEMLGKLCKKIAKQYTKEKSINQFNKVFWEIVKKIKK